MFGILNFNNKRLVDTIRSGLLLKIFSKCKNITSILNQLSKQRAFTKVIKMPSSEAWVERPVGLIKQRGGVLKVICAGLQNGIR
jgi:hypothetical protein